MAATPDFDAFEPSGPFGILVPKFPAFAVPGFVAPKTLILPKSVYWDELVTSANGVVVKIPPTPKQRSKAFAALLKSAHDDMLEAMSFGAHLLQHGPFYVGSRFDRPSWADWELVTMCKAWQDYTPPILDHTVEKGWQN